MHSFRYSRWIDSANIGELPAEDLLDRMADDVLAQGDLAQAMRRLVHDGASDRNGVRMDGIQDLLRRVKDQRSELLQQYNINELVDRLRDGVERAVDQERRGIQERLDGLRQRRPQHPWDGDTEQFENMFRQLAAKRLTTLDALPGDLGGKVQSLQNYDFLDQDARQQFQQVMDELQAAVLGSFFQSMSQRLESLTPEDMAQIERMVRAIQRMAQARLQDGAPEFQRFMEEFGDYFGDQPPENLDQLLEQVQSQMTRMQSLLNSLSREQQAALRDLVNSRLLSPGLDEALGGLAQTLWNHFSYRQRGQGYGFSGQESITMEEALRLMGRLHEMDRLERQLDRVGFGAPLEELDRETVQQVLGEKANQTLDALGKVTERLEAAGLVERSEGRVSLTPRGIRRIGQKALLDVFQSLKRAAFGNHGVKVPGPGQELTDETRTYEFGQPFHLHLERTLRNALIRGGGVPIRLDARDFEVYGTERMVRTATVLMLDLSRSMPMRGNFTAAKKVALALNQLIRTQFPRDYLYLVGFSGFAREVKSQELPTVEVGEFGRGTNMQAGLAVARKLLARHKGATRQVIMITDGEPTAYVEHNGQVLIEFPPSGRVLRATLNEVQRCTREDITINIFMLERSYALRGFVQQMAQSNKGRVFFTSAEQLGEYLLVDYLAHKRRLIG